MISLPVVEAEITGDLANGPTGGMTDVVNPSSAQSCYMLVREVAGTRYIIFRFRIGKASSAAKGYSVMLDTDLSFSGSGANPGYEKEVQLTTGGSGAVNVNTFNTSGSISSSATFPVGNYSQYSIAATTDGSDPDYFYDFFVPYNALGISGTVRMLAVTIISPSSGISGTPSDFNGIVDNKYGNNPLAIASALMSAFPPTDLSTMTAGASFANPITSAPYVNPGVNSVSTAITGTSNEANGTSIAVYKNGVLLGTTTVSGGTWSLSVTAGLVTDNDAITARATASGKQQSGLSNSVLSTYCSVTAPSITTRSCSSCTGSNYGPGGTWSMSGVTPNGSNVEIKLYTQDGSGNFVAVTPKVAGTKNYVQANGSWQFITSLTASDWVSANIFATATLVSTGCESGKSNVSVKTSGNTGTITTTPVITTASINTETTSISVRNDNANAVKLILYLDGNEVANSGATGIASGSSHTFSVSGLHAGDEVTARAQSFTTNFWLSNVSAAVIVAGTTSGGTASAPVITGSYTQGSGKTVTGTSSEGAGATINLYKASTTLLGTATVNGYGAWSVSGLTLATGDVLTAKASVTGKTESTASASKTVSSGTPSAPAISGSVSYKTTSISGTGGSGTVTLYVDGTPIATTTASGGSWSFSGIAAGQFYKGGQVTVSNTNADGVESPRSSAVTITGPHRIDLALSGAAPTVAGQSFNISANAMSAASGGSVVTDFTGRVTFSGSSTLQTGGGQSAAFASGVLGSHAMSLRTSGVAYTITAISNDDPTVTGTLSIPAVSPGAATQVVLTTPADITAGNRAAYTVSLKDAYGNNATQGSNLTLYLSANGTTGLFKSAATAGSDITTVSIPAGQSTASFWFYAEKAGAYTITVSDAATPDFANGLADATDALTVNAGAASKFVLVGFPQMYKNADMTVTAQLSDAFGNPVATAGQSVAWTKKIDAGSTTALSGSPTTTGSDGRASLTVNFPNSATNGEIYLITATSGSNFGQLSVTVADGKVWKGNTDKNHKNPPNWTDNAPPGSTETKPLYFAPDASNPLELTEDQVFSDIYLNSSNANHKIVLKGKKLTVTGKIIVQGSARIEAKDPSDVLEFSGSANQSIPANIFLDNEVRSIVVNQSAADKELVIEGTTNVRGTLTVSKGKLKTNGNLILKSDADGTARVAPVTADGAIEGDVTVERYIPRYEVTGTRNGRAWRLISIPVTGSATLRDYLMSGRTGTDLTISSNLSSEPSGTGTPIIGHAFADAGEAYAAGYDFLLSNQVSSLRRYVGNPAGGTFSSSDVPDLNTKLSNADQGYMVYTRGDRRTDYTNASNASATTFTSVGTLKTGDQTVTVVPSTTSPFTLVGNPYMAQLNLETLYSQNSDAIDPVFYIWDANLTSTVGGVLLHQGGFRIYSKSGTSWFSNITHIGIDPIENPGLIESGQAFFVVPKSGMISPATLTIRESQKVVNAAQTSPFDVGQSPAGRLHVILELETPKGERMPLNGVVAGFSQTHQVGVGDAADVDMINTMTGSPIWFRHPGRILASEGQPWPDLQQPIRTLRLGLTGLQNGQHVLRFQPSAGLSKPGQTFWLKDRVRNTETAIDNKIQTEYRFNGTGLSADSGRFDIIVKYIPPAPADFLHADAVRVTNGVEVAWATPGDEGTEYTVEHSRDGENFTAVSKVLARGDSLNKYVWVDERPLEGVQFYRIRSANGAGFVKNTRVMRVNASPDARAWSVYPNPVSGAEVALQLEKVPAGTYDVSMVDAVGRQITSKRIRHAGGSAMHTIELNGKLQKGTYFIKVQSDAGHLSTIKILGQ